jgi:hypothetical protein
MLFYSLQRYIYRGNIRDYMKNTPNPHENTQGTKDVLVAMHLKTLQHLELNLRLFSKQHF